MEKTLQDLTTKLQTLCHEGMATVPVKIRFDGAFYCVKGLRLEHDENGNEFIALDAEGAC